MRSPEQAFGVVLRRLRTESGLSQERLAQEAGLDRTFISLLERGLRQPTLTTILQLSASLGTASDVILKEVQGILNEDRSY